MKKSFMKPLAKILFPAHQRGSFIRSSCAGFLTLLVLLPLHAHASMFKGEALDAVADAMTWVVLVIAPVIGIGVFLIVHVLPEKIAESWQEGVERFRRERERYLMYE